MANLKSSKKAIRVSQRRQANNIKIKKAFKDVRKDINKLLKNGKIDEAKKLMPKYHSEIAKAVKKHTIKKNTGARYLSRIAKKINKNES